MINSYLKPKNFFAQAARALNDRYGRKVCEVIVKDQYYNMYEIIKDHMECVNVAKAAMEKLVLHLFVYLFEAAQTARKYPLWVSLHQISLLA